MAASATSAKIVGLRGSVSYTFSVYALNSFGNGPSASSSAQTPSGPGVTYASSVLSDQPTSYYRLDDTGPLFTDSAGGHDAWASSWPVRNQAGAVLTDGDGAVAPNGQVAGQYYLGDGVPNGAAARTAEGWIKTTSGSGQDLVSWGASGTESTFSLVLGGSGSQAGEWLGAETSSNNLWWYVGRPVDDGNWHLLDVTYDGGTSVTMYYDGTSLGSQSLTSQLNTPVSSLYLGGSIWSGSDYLSGSAEMDDVAIFGTALSSARIQAHREEAGLAGGPLTPSQTSPSGGRDAGPCDGGDVQSNATSSPVNTATGNFWHTLTDLSIAGRSCPLAFTQTYSAQAAAAGITGALGYGWTDNYGMSLAVTGSSPNQVATITNEDGSQASFTQPSTGSAWPPAAPRFIATLTQNGDGSWTYVRQGYWIYAFNSAGQLTSKKDPNGYTTSYAYASGNLTTVTDPAGRLLTLNWSGGHITSVLDANVSGNTRTVSFTYDGNGNLTDVTDVNGGDTHFTYDSSHRVTVMKDPVCQAAGDSCPGVENTYDSSNRVTAQSDQLNQTTSFVYNGDGTVEVTVPAGHSVLSTYSQGLLVSQTAGYGTTSAATTSYAYDPSTLALTAVTDPNGNTTTYTVDSSGNVLTATDPLGRVTTKTYNSFNEILTVKDGNGVTTTNTYDGSGNLSQTSRPLTGTSQNQVTTYTHGNNTYPGDVTSITDPDGKVTSYAYDSYGNVAQVKDPLGNVSDTVYNADDWVTARYTPKAGCTWNASPPSGCSASYETQYGYTGGSSTDEFGDVQKVTDPLGHSTSYTYDADRHQTSITDGDGNTTTNAYDYAGELCWTLPGGSSSNGCSSPPTDARVTDYNADGTVKDQKDGKGNAILTYAYDSRGDVTSVTDALGNVTTYTYDLDGNVLTKLDAVTGATCSGTPVGCTTYTYDADSELKTVSYSDSSSENISRVTYDSDGQRTGMTDGTGSSSWGFDSLHRLTSYTNGNGDTVTYGYTYGSGPTYDLKNQVRSIAYPDSVGTVTQSWNDDGTLASVTDWNSKTTTFSYDANANEIGETVPSTTNVVDTFGYNAANQITSVSDSNGSTLFSATYSRDGNGQVSSDSSVPSTLGSYRYNGLNQLCYAGSTTTNACSSPPSGSQAYGFDNGDNLTVNNGNTQQFNNADELCWTVSGTSSNACSTAPPGAIAYSYDNKGNRTSQVPGTGSATCYTYDQANRLTEIQTGTGSTCSTPATVGAYAYDGDGLRASKSVSGTTTHFTWDGMGGNLLQQKVGSTVTSFIYGPLGMPVEQVSGGTTTYLHHDQLGSTRLLTDAAGSTGTATTAMYDPYGNVTATVGTLNTPLMYTGQYLDSESSLYYQRGRYYDPPTGQFLSRDPAVASTLSPYGYVGGNPLNATDPTGMFCFAFWSSSCEIDLPGGNCIANGAPGCSHGDTGLANLRDNLADPHPTGFIAFVRDASAPVALGSDIGRSFECGGNVSFWDWASVPLDLIPGAGFASGREIAVGNDVRISPLGNWTADNWAARLPHYHQRIFDDAGNVTSGGSVRWHRPWEP